MSESKRERRAILKSDKSHGSRGLISAFRVNAVDDDKETPLLCTAVEGHVEVAKMLLQIGVDVNVANNEGRSSLDIAACNGRVAYLLQLICFGAVVDDNGSGYDRTELLLPIYDRLNSLRAGNGMKTTLMSDEENDYCRHVPVQSSITIQIVLNT